jgi:O-antigen/teichoic acid export membrane protein
VPEPKRHRGISGVLSSSATGLLSIATGILLLPLIISTVGSGPYGVWLVLIAVAAYLQLTDLGIGSALIHFGSRTRGGAEFDATPGGMLGAALLWNAVAGVVGVTGFGIAATLYVSSADAAAVVDPATGHALALLGAVALSSILLKPFDAVLTGAGELPVERRNMFIGLSARIVVTLLGCLVFESLLVVAIAEVVAIVLPSIISMTIVLRRITRPHWSRATFATLRFMWRFSLRSFATASVGMLILQVGTVLVAIVATPSAVTYFTAAFRVYTGVRQVFSWTTDPFKSMLARVFVGDHRQGRQIVMTLGFISLLVAGTGCAIIILLAEDFTRIWLGADVPTGTIALTIMILLSGIVLNSIHVQFVPAADALGRPAAFLGLQVLWLVLYVVLGLWLGSLWGTVGVAAAFALPLLIVEPLYVMRARAVLGFSTTEWLRNTIRPAASIVVPPALIGSAIALLFPSIGNLVGATVVAVSVVGTLYALRRRPPVSNVPELLRTEL